MTCVPVVYGSPFYLLLLQILSLLLFIGTIFYFFQRRAKPWALQEMQASEQELLEKEEQKELLAQKQRQIDQEILDQRVLFEQLQASVEKWRIGYDRERRALDERHTLLAQKVVDDMKVRQHMLHELYLRERAVPQAQEKVRKLLQEKYANSNEGRNFLSALCAHIAKEIK